MIIRVHIFASTAKRYQLNVHQSVYLGIRMLEFKEKHHWNSTVDKLYHVNIIYILSDILYFVVNFKNVTISLGL